MENTKNSKLLFLCLILVIILALTLSVFLLKYANNFEASAYSISENDSKILSINDNLYIESETKQFSVNEKIYITFKLKSSAKIISVNSKLSGFEIETLNYNKNKIEVSLIVQPWFDYCNFTMNVELSNGNIIEKTIYAFVNDYGTFISEISKEDANNNFYIYLNKLIIAEQNKTESEIQTKAVVYTRASGTLQWKDDANNLHPLQYVQVELYDYDSSISSDLLGRAITTVAGRFEFLFINKDKFLDFENGGYDLYFKVYAAGVRFSVEKINGESYFFKSSTKSNVQTGGNSTWPTTQTIYDMTSDLGKAFQISQPIIHAANYAKEMNGGVSMPSVTVKYPINDPLSDTSYYSVNENTIYLMDPDYLDWDVIMHEYGHHVQYYLEITESPGTEHQIDWNMADHYRTEGTYSDSEAKYQGIRIAWSEAWASIFGMAAQKYYDGRLNNTISSINDEEFEGFPMDDLKTFKLGDACEGSIMHVLWNIFLLQTETDTNTGHHNFWNDTTVKTDLVSVVTFSDYANWFYVARPEYFDAFGDLLSLNGMAVATFGFWTITEENCPTLTIAKRGGSVEYKNNQFKIVFYQEDMDHIFTTQPFSIASSDELVLSAYTLTTAEWQTVRTSYLPRFKYAVVAYQNDPLNEQANTGGYYTSTKIETNPTIEKVSFNSGTVRYIEKIFNVDKGIFKEFIVSSYVSRKIVIQTFGYYATFLEIFDISGNRLAYNALNGYNSNALISYTLSANTNYLVRVKFMDSNMEGRIKVAFTPARNISQFEDIISFNEVSSLNTYEVVPYINYINIFTYTSATTRSVTFYTTTVDGLTDYENTYLYIIDPRSTSICTNYNDNSGGNNQAYLQVTLTANIPYIIIASLYDLSVSADDYNLIIA